MGLVGYRGIASVGNGGLTLISLTLISLKVDPVIGGYEWLIRTERGRIKQHSDCGYGIAAIALRNGLIAYFGMPQDRIEP